MRTLVLGDIHGAYQALMQVFEKSKFDYKKDRLICLGDVADGWVDVHQCFDELLKVKNLVYIRGNHDQWLKDYFSKGKEPRVWTLQGGQNSIRSYLCHNDELKKKHLAFLKKTKCYFVDEKNRVYVHGGLKPAIPVESNEKIFLMWDRLLWENRNSDSYRIMQYREVYVGHTSIYNFSRFPLRNHNVWFMDTGAGWEGVLSIMDVDTKEFWQSDKCSDLYHGVIGR
jgi:serine/threonine protein phosphatase 1